MFHTDYFVLFAIIYYVLCTAWVMYNLSATIRSLQKDVADLNADMDVFCRKKYSIDSETETDESRDSNTDDESSETSSLGPCPSMTVELPTCESNDQAIHARLTRIEDDLELHLDRTFMLVGFEPYTGMPLYVTQHDDDGTVVVRDAVADYWRSGNMPAFVGRQFDGPDSEGSELDDR